MKLSKKINITIKELLKIENLESIKYEIRYSRKYKT